MPWPPSSTPAIVAEALVAVAHPMRTALRAGPPADGCAVVAALAAMIGLPAAADPPPPWLLGSQHRAYGRALAALRRHGGALLAEPTGSGKTFIALAVAWRWQRTPVACIVPAALAAKWQATAAALTIPVVITTHERASRGRLPAGTKGLVLVDESHHFRHPRIRRYAYLADFLIGRPALLISATPVVNRTGDLAHQLRLAVRDDALAADGVSSLATTLPAGPGALGALVISTRGAEHRLPVRSAENLRPPMSNSAETLLAGISRLGLSSDSAIARLIRGVLWRALVSSPAALLGALRRYQSLLTHACDARRGGRTVSRQTLRSWVGAVTDQTVLWELLPDEGSSTDLLLDDATSLALLVSQSEAACHARDPKLEQLRALLTDGRATLIFCSARETVTYLRRRLTDAGWCTGDAAGIGGLGVARAALFAAFGTASGPRVLVASDVAAEGLDLQAAERVVHYDLPWTATRLEQREGRVVRLGSRHLVVSVARFDPPASLERRLRQCAVLTRSARAPLQLGIGPTSSAAGVWQWRDVLAHRFAGRTACEGVAAIRSSVAGVLAGLSVEDESAGRTVGTALVWLGADGRARDDAPWLLARADEAARAGDRAWNCDELDAALDALARPAARQLRSAQQARWSSVPRSPAVRAVIRRLAADARHAARRRDPRELDALERALSIVGGGLTAGEARLIERLAASPGPEICAALERVPPRAGPPGVVAVRLRGLILFGPE